MAKFVTKMVLYFEAPVADLTNHALTKETYKVLAQQVQDYAEAVRKDPNVVIMDTVFITKDEDYKARSDTPVNVRLAEAMAGKTAALTSKYKPRKEEAESEPALPVANTSVPPLPPESKEKPGKKAAKKAQNVFSDEEPRVVAVDLAQLQREQAEDEAAAKKASAPQPAPVAKETAADDVKDIVDKIFETRKRAQKSVTLITALAKAGKELTTQELMDITGLSNSDISSWFGQTAKDIPAVTKVRRGVFKLDPEKV